MDTGASLSFLRTEEAYEIGTPFKLIAPVRIEFGKGSTRIQEMMPCVVRLNGYNIHWHFYVVPGLTEAAVIGADFFQHYRIKINPKTEELIIDPKYLRAKLV